MIAAFTRLDLSGWFMRTQTILTLAFVAASGIVIPVPGMAILGAALVTSLMVSAPFLGDERGRLDTLYGVLPITRRTIVIGRVLSILVYFLIAAVVATVVTLIVALVRGQSVPIEFMLIAHAAALAFVGIALALQVPVFFRVGYSRGRFMAYAPAFLTVAAIWLLQATGAGVDFQEFVAGVPIAVIAALGALVPIVALVCSIMVSVSLYRNREL